MKFIHYVALTFCVTGFLVGASDAQAIQRKTKKTVRPAVKKMVSKKKAKRNVVVDDGITILSGSGSMDVSRDTTRSVRTRDVTISKGKPFNTATVTQMQAEAQRQAQATQRAASNGVSSTRPVAPKIQRPIPPQFTAVDTAGQQLTLQQYRGRVVLLDFWATWCPPCREEVPGLVRLHRAYNRSGLEIVGVSLDREAATLSSYTRSNGMGWRQIFGTQARSIATTYGVSGIPFNVVIGRDGTAVAIDVHGDTLNRVIAEALAERN